MRRKGSFFALFAGLVILAVFHVSALQNSWYWEYKHLDMIMHFFGAAWVTVASASLYLHTEWFRRIVGEYSVYVVAFWTVAVLGVLWEVFEFSWETFIRITNHHPLDTASDLLFDVLGALSGAGYFYVNERKHARKNTGEGE